MFFGRMSTCPTETHSGQPSGPAVAQEMANDDHQVTGDGKTCTEATGRGLASSQEQHNWPEDSLGRLVRSCNRAEMLHCSENRENG